jgi:hypothetical protein
MSALGDYLLKYHPEALFNEENKDVKDAFLEVLKKQDEALKEVQKVMKPFVGAANQPNDWPLTDDLLITTVSYAACKNAVAWLEKYASTLKSVE